jgi:competence protein ComEC
LQESFFLRRGINGFGFLRYAEGTVYRWFIHKAKPLCGDSFQCIATSFFSRPIVILALFGYVGSFCAFSFSVSSGAIICFSIFLFALALSRLSIKDDHRYRLRIVISLTLGAILMSYSFACVSLRKSTATERVTGNGIHSRSIYDEFVGVIRSVDESDSGYQTFVMEMDHGELVMFGGMDVFASEGDYVSVLGRMTRIAEANNPGGFSRYDYYSRKGIFLEIATYDSCIRIIKKDAVERSVWDRLSTIGEQMRLSLGEAFRLVLSREDAGLLMAMLLGDTTKVPPELKSDFRLLNLSHLTAVSGANIAFFLMPASGAVRIIKGHRKVRGAILLLFLLFLGFLTGWSASVSRAIMVAATHIISDLSAKRHCPICSICFALAFMIFIDPFIAVDIGFCLSASAALSLVIFSDTVVKSFTHFGLNRNIASLFAPAICAHIGMLPWMIHLSGRESLLLFVLNIIGSFLAEGISILGLAAVPSLIFPLSVQTVWPASFCFAPVRGLLFLLRELTSNSVTLGIHAFRLQTVEPFLLFAIAGAFISFLIRKSYVKRLLGVLAAVFLCAGLAFQVFAIQKQPVASIIFSDVGQGDACLVILQDGKSILIDAGTEEAGESVLLPMLNYYGIDKVDLCILTHLHGDHGGGFLPLVRENRVSSIFTPAQNSGSELSNLFFLCETENVKIHTLKKDDRIMLCGYASVKVMQPSDITENGGNADSAVLFLEVQGTGILLMGDSGFEQEELLGIVDSSATLIQDTDILKVGHHGSKYSTGDAFLSMICAESAIISVGENGYGHPAEDTLFRLNEHGVKTFRTDRSGAVVVEIYNNEYQIQTSLSS